MWIKHDQTRQVLLGRPSSWAHLVETEAHSTYGQVGMWLWVMAPERPG